MGGLRRAKKLGDAGGLVAFFGDYGWRLGYVKFLLIFVLGGGIMRTINPVLTLIFDWQTG